MSSLDHLIDQENRPQGGGLRRVKGEAEPRPRAVLGEINQNRGRQANNRTHGNKPQVDFFLSDIFFICFVMIRVSDPEFHFGRIQVEKKIRIRVHYSRNGSWPLIRIKLKLYRSKNCYCFFFKLIYPYLSNFGLLRGRLSNVNFILKNSLSSSGW